MDGLKETLVQVCLQPTKQRTSRKNRQDEKELLPVEVAAKTFLCWDCNSLFSFCYYLEGGRKSMHQERQAPVQLLPLLQRQKGQRSQARKDSHGAEALRLRHLRQGLHSADQLAKHRGVHTGERRTNAPSASSGSHT